MAASLALPRSWAHLSPTISPYPICSWSVEMFPMGLVSPLSGCLVMSREEGSITKMLAS